ncbi:5'-nucleotidase C-terminal domain-containing protein [Aneurinibacillus terranovensis]|uniref:5'-nucleotidase C-terminal domain-containing protein n=1 Tax=Aneurinibacillus terranovensis TaxID=278991 RepID=UPI0003FF804D|nr:5'-nucleotidase C-terminal domain-containing protein [Aneurinibacillus terranovensis]
MNDSFRKTLNQLLASSLAFGLFFSPAAISFVYADQNRWEPYKMITKTFKDENGQEQTLKIGVIGFVPPQIMQWDKANLEGKVTAKDIVETAKKYIPEMKAKGADLIIALDHSGFDKTDRKGMDENTAYYLSQVPGIDAILFGHAHLTFPSADPTFQAPGVDSAKGTVNGVAAVEAASFGKALGVIDLTLKKENGNWKVAASRSNVLPVYDSTSKKALVTPDADVLNAVKAEHEATLQYIRGPVGKTTAPINSFFALVQDDPSIQIVTNAQKWYAEQQIKGTKYEGKTEAKKDIKEDTVDVQLLGINDFHGHLDYSKTNKDGSVVGGASYLAAYLKQLAQQNPNTLLVHAGDAVGASNLESSLLQDEPTIEFLNKMGFAVGTLGNHEFDHGKDEALRLIQGGVNPKTGEKFGGAPFPYVCANVIDEATGKPFLPPYVVKEIHGTKIGFIGVMTNETPNIVKQEGIKGLKFVDQAPAVNKAVDELKKQGVYTIVVLAHDPGYGSGDTASGEVIDLAKAVDPEVDVIFGGHNHGLLNVDVQNNQNPKKKIKVVEAYSYGTAFDDVDVKINKKTDDAVSVTATIVDVKHEGMTPDAEVARMVNGYVEKIAPISNAKIGTAAADITRTVNENGESALGDVIADAMKEGMNADFAFMNSGGIRDDIKAGDITYGKLFSVQPFGNILVKLSLTGKDLRALLNQQWQANGMTRIGQIAGFTYAYDDSKPIGQKVIDMKKQNGTPIHDDEAYTIAVNDFCRGGGDGFASLKGLKKVDSGVLDLDAFIDYVKAHSPLYPSGQNRFQKVSQ